MGFRDTKIANRKLWRGVPKWLIRRFLENYSIHKTHVDLLPEMLLPFLDGGDSRLNLWNLGVIEPRDGVYSEYPLGSLGPVRTSIRSKLIDSGSVADLKAIMTLRDVLFDRINNNTHNSWKDAMVARQTDIGPLPLLLLYPIGRISRPKEMNNGRPPVREPLNAVRDVLGIGLVFPGSVTESGNSVAVELRPISAEEASEIAQEEAAQVEAAGVQ